MRTCNGKKSHGEEWTIVSDSFLTKKFVLKSSSEIFKGQSFEEPFFFSGFIFTVCLKGEATIRQHQDDAKYNPVIRVLSYLIVILLFYRHKLILLFNFSVLLCNE